MGMGRKEILDVIECGVDTGRVGVISNPHPVNASSNVEEKTIVSLTS